MRHDDSWSGINSAKLKACASTILGAEVDTARFGFVPVLTAAFSNDAGAFGLQAFALLNEI
jgi:hypothetical protein